MEQHKLTNRVNKTITGKPFYIHNLLSGKVYKIYANTTDPFKAIDTYLKFLNESNISHQGWNIVDKYKYKSQFKAKPTVVKKTIKVYPSKINHICISNGGKELTGDPKNPFKLTKKGKKLYDERFRFISSTDKTGLVTVKLMRHLSKKPYKITTTYIIDHNKRTKLKRKKHDIN